MGRPNQVSCADITYVPVGRGFLYLVAIVLGWKMLGLERSIMDWRHPHELVKSWAELSSVFRPTREAYLEHENAKAELKGLMPEDAKEAIGHGIRAKRSKSCAVSFELLSMEGSTHAPLQ